MNPAAGGFLKAEKNNNTDILNNHDTSPIRSEDVSELKHQRISLILFSYADFHFPFVMWTCN